MFFAALYIEPRRFLPYFAPQPRKKRHLSRAALYPDGEGTKLLRLSLREELSFDNLNNDTALNQFAIWSGYTVPARPRSGGFHLSGLKAAVLSSRREAPRL